MPNRVVVNRMLQSDIVLPLTFSLNTSAYDSGDLIADTQELAAVAAEAGAIVTLDSVTIVDKADQKTVMFLVFVNDNTSLGTENSAPGISDANSTKVVGVVPIVAADYVDLGGASVASVRNIGLRMQCSTTSLWVGIVNSTGTPTYAASDLVASFYFRRS